MPAEGRLLVLPISRVGTSNWAVRDLLRPVTHCCLGKPGGLPRGSQGLSCLNSGVTQKLDLISGRESRVPQHQVLTSGSSVFHSITLSLQQCLAGPRLSSQAPWWPGRVRRIS